MLRVALGQFLNSLSLFLGCFSKVMHLGFSLAISAHLLTVLYPMMFGSVEQYGGLGVNGCCEWFLGGFEFISVFLFILILCYHNSCCLGFYWVNSAHPLTVFYQMMLEHVKRYGSCCVPWMSGVCFVAIFYFISVIF